MKTPMQEHIEFLKKEWKKLVIEGHMGIALHIGDCIEHAESMLEKKKEFFQTKEELVCDCDIPTRKSVFMNDEGYDYCEDCDGHI